MAMAIGVVTTTVATAVPAGADTIVLSTRDVGPAKNVLLANEAYAGGGRAGAYRHQRGRVLLVSAVHHPEWQGIGGE